MPLNLHQGCKDRLKQLLVEQLPTVEVTNKKFIKKQSTTGFLTASEALPEHGPAIDSLQNYIGEWPFYDFLYGFLSKELNDDQAYDSSESLLKLTEIDEYSDVEATATRLVDEFESLPWQYKYTIDIKSSLSQIFTGTKTNYELTDSINIAKPDETFIKNHPVQTLEGGNSRNLLSLGLLGGFISREWASDTIYLQFITRGFVGKYVTSQTTETVLSSLKSFLGLSIALRLLKVEHTYHPATPKLHFIIHKNVAGNWVADETEEINEETSRTISDLVFNDLDGDLDTDALKSSWINRCLKSLSAVFEEKEKSEKVLLAGQWFFESYSGRNELLSFVQTMVALEILLGDKASSDVIGLGELLRNRCAYLIGKTHDQRESILNDFKDIYEIRSKIVHRGKSKLTINERTLFRKLQWLCRRVIQEEIELLKSNA